MFEDRQYLFAKMDESFRRMQVLLDRFSDAAEIYEGWTRKEVLAHFAGWDAAVLDIARAELSRADITEPGVYLGVDYYNQQSVAERNDLAYDQILREWHFARAELIALMSEMSAEQYAKKIVVPWGGSQAVYEIVERVLLPHEDEHIQNIQNLRQ